MVSFSFEEFGGVEDVVPPTLKLLSSENDSQLTMNTAAKASKIAEIVLFYITPSRLSAHLAVNCESKTQVECFRLQFFYIEDLPCELITEHRDRKHHIIAVRHFTIFSFNAFCIISHFKKA